MSRIFTFIFILFTIPFIFAQSGFDTLDIRCGTMYMDQIRRTAQPGLGTLDQFESWMQEAIRDYQNSNPNLRAPLLTIPVVFHVITDGAGPDNISANLIQEQLNQLNLDFRNLAGSNDPAAADVEMEFCLATLDPNDNIMPEPGINRITNYGDGPFSSNFVDNNIKPGTSWDPNSYMNIWVADLSGGLLGWAQFPDNSGLGGMPGTGGAGNTDGVVVLTSSVGSMANPNPNGGVYGMGRTLTHEVGHWVGLRHIWGDGNCNFDDFCNDTPDSDAANFGCPNHNSCGNRDMVENYMDYTNDACMDIFTNDQKTRVRTVMSVSPRRQSLPNSAKCGIAVPTIAFVSSGGTMYDESTDCNFQDFDLDLSISSAPSADATVVISATGSATETSDFEILNNVLVFPAGQTQNQTTTVRIYNDGIIETNESILLEFTVSTTGDAMATSSDLKDHDITITDDDFAPQTGMNMVILSENFEGGNLGVFTTQGRTGSDRFINGDAAASSSAFWNVSATNSSLFACSNDDRCNCDKRNDRLTSPIFSLAGTYNTINLTFDHAFADVGTESAILQINTGGGWNNLLTLTNNSTLNGNVYTTPWMTESVDLSAYLGQTNVQIRFVYNDNSQWAYGLAIDNIEIVGTAAMNIQITDNTILPRFIPVPGFEKIYYYDPASGDVMGSLENLSSWDYQCTRMEVDRDMGVVNGAAPFIDNNPMNYLAAKTFYVSPSTNNPTGIYKIELFYTEAEIQAWENITGKSRNTLKIIKVTNTPIDVVTPGNFQNYTIEVQPATLTAFGNDHILSATFSTGFSGFGIGDPDMNILLPNGFVNFVVEKESGNARLSWSVESVEQILEYSIEKSIDAIEFNEIHKLSDLKQSDGTDFYHLDQNVAPGYNYYRLKYKDVFSNTYTTATKVLNFQEDAIISDILVSPNPFTNDLLAEFSSEEKGEIAVTIMDAIGNICLNEQMMQVKAGKNKLLINVENLSAGLYLIKFRKGNNVLTQKVIKK